MNSPLHRDIKALAGILATSGVIELACAVGLLVPRSRSVAGWASLDLLLAVYPANLKMAVDSNRTDNRTFKAVAFARLPMQLPMLWSAYRAARGS